MFFVCLWSRLVSINSNTDPSYERAMENVKLFRGTALLLQNCFVNRVGLVYQITQPGHPQPLSAPGVTPGNAVREFMSEVKQNEGLLPKSGQLLGLGKCRDSRLIP